MTSLTDVGKLAGGDVLRAYLEENGSVQISALPDGSPLQSTDEFIVARGGADYKIPASAIGMPVVDSALYLVGDDSTDDTSGFASFTAACMALGIPGYLRGNKTYKVTGTIDFTGKQLAILCDDAVAPVIKQYTDNIPVIKVGGEMQKIGNLEVTFHNAQAYTNTNAIGIQFSKDANGTGSFRSQYGPWHIYNTALAMNADNLTPPFACDFEAIRISTFSIGALNIPAGNGNNFEVFYVYNANGNCQGPVFQFAGYDCFVGSMNIENCVIHDQGSGSDGTALVVYQGTLDIGTLHIEDCEKATDKLGWIDVTDGGSLHVGSLVLENCTYDAGTRKPIIYLGTTHKVRLKVGTVENFGATVTVTDHPLVQVDASVVAGSTCEIEYVYDETEFTELVYGDAVSTPAVRRVGLHYYPATNYVTFKLVDDTTAVTVGEAPQAANKGPVQFTIPATLNGKKLCYADASVSVAPTGTGLSFGVRKGASTEMLSTNITIDTTKVTSDQSATQPAINGTNASVATGDVISIDVDQADSSTADRGAIVTLGFN